MHEELGIEQAFPLLPPQEKSNPMLVNIYLRKIAFDNKVGSFFRLTTKVGLRLSGWDWLNMRLLPWKAGILFYWCVGLPHWNLLIATKAHIFVNVMKLNVKRRREKTEGTISTPSLCDREQALKEIHSGFNPLGFKHC